MITPTTFKTRFPEFTTTADAKIQLFIDDAITQISGYTFGTSYDIALAYLTAHYLTLAEKSSIGNNGNVGSVSSKSVEGVSVSYNQAQAKNQKEAYYQSTTYGQRFLEIKAQVAVANVMSI